MDGILGAPFCSSVFLSLHFDDLAAVEATCSSLRGVLSDSTLSSDTWSSIACATARRARVILPETVLAAMPIQEVKRTLSALLPVQGQIDGDICCIKTAEELQQLTTVAREASAQLARQRQLLGHAGNNTQLVAGRFYFDLRDIDDALDSAAAAAAANEQNQNDEQSPEPLCFSFSSEVAFPWPQPASSSPSSCGAGSTTLVASLGFRPGANVLEICTDDLGGAAAAATAANHGADASPTTTTTTIPLAVDVFLADPALPHFVDVFEVDVDKRCGSCLSPAMDLEDPETRRSLTSQDGVLFILCVRSTCGDEAQTLPAVYPATTAPLAAPSAASVVAPTLGESSYPAFIHEESQEKKEAFFVDF